MYGTEIAKRRAEGPDPGTIYPTLESLEGRGQIQAYQLEATKVYWLAPKGRSGLAEAKRFVVQAYGDIAREAD